MAKRKLVKRGGSSGGNLKVTKSIPVTDKNGNKSVLRATVIGVEPETIKKQQSSAIVDDDVNSYAFGSEIIQPPLSQKELSVLSEYSSELGPNIDQFVLGVEGFGQKIEPRKMSLAEMELYKEKIPAEERWIQTHVIENPNPNSSLRRLRKQLLQDREHTGNAYVELVPNATESFYSCYNRIEPSNMWITKADKTFTRFTQKYVDENLRVKEKRFMKRFRKFVQVVGKQKVFFKEFRDPRPMDARTGEVLRIRSNETGKQVPVDKDGKEVKKKYLAREVFHFKLESTRRTPYGMPRFTGNIIGIKGSRSSEESNIMTLQNNNIPSMAVMVSGGMLTDGSIERIQEFVDTSIKSDLNYSKFLIIEGESDHDSLSGASSMKIDIKPLTNEQHTDALWSEYDNKNNTKVRRSFRHPKALVGDTDKLSKDEMLTSEIFAEKYIYNPEREDLDEDWNKILVNQSIRFHTIKTNSPNVTNEEVLVKVLSGAEKTGGVTPRISRMILGNILNVELPEFKEDPDFDPDLPFSISVGKLARGAARSNQEGTMSTTGQQEGDKGEDNNDKKEDDAEKSFLGVLEDIMDEEVFGEAKRDFFKHEH